MLTQGTSSSPKDKGQRQESRLRLQGQRLFKVRESWRSCDIRGTTHIRVVGCQGVGLELTRLNKIKLSNVHDDIQYL